MKSVLPAGIFEVLIPGATIPFAYRLEVRYARGSFTLRDAYAFPPAIGDLDVHLLREGTHQEVVA